MSGVVNGVVSPAGANAIWLRGLRVHAGPRTMLEVPELRIRAGERVAIVGPNGAGKSTLLRVLTGFAPAAGTSSGTSSSIEGEVQVLGQTLAPQPLRGAALRRLRAQVGQVHQGLHLVARLSARDNVLIGALARYPGWRSWARLHPPALAAEADAALAAVGLLERAEERVDRLSGGERQKLSIARLRLQRPQLVLADEPTANLDPNAAAQACRWLAEAAPGATRLTVLHQLALVPLLAERVIALQQGRVVLDQPWPAADNVAADALLCTLKRLYEPQSTSPP